MNWLNVQNISWSEPLAVAKTYSNTDIALLYSGMQDDHTGQKSYLFIAPMDVAEGATWDALPSAADDDQNLPDWVGYLAYEMGAPVAATPSPIALPRFRLVRYAHMLEFDHHAKRITHYARANAPNPLSAYAATASVGGPLRITNLTSNFTREDYEARVRATVDEIAAGNFYQANITRKFWGSFAQEPDAFAIFTSLAHASPAPYSAFIRHQGSAILSASPESFLQIAPDGNITTRPIKGSAPRGATAQEDEAIRNTLATSDKNHAENLMIVDLMRNDLAQVSVPQSVAVTEHSGLHSYAMIHHLISTITAQKLPNASVVDVLKSCFPPGSMTGAPKIAAMDWCAQQEAMQRGVYSGAIGWFGAKNSCALSVVIRTLIIQQTQFEFQVGGGIVADSLPHDEWQETMTKARGILAALGVSEETLAAI